MSNLKLTFLAIFCFLFLTDSISQTDFTKGYVALNNNDTLSGFLKQEPEGNLLSRVVFSNNENGNPSSDYTASDIKAFYFNGGNFFESIHFTNVNNLPAVYFAKYILKGYYNLYSFRKNDSLYFIIKHQDTTYLLYNDVILSSGDYDTKGNYQNQFLFLSRNCGNLSSQVTQLRYSENDFVKFTQKINDCVAPGSTTDIVAVKSKSTANFYVYAGALPLSDKYDFAGRIGARITTPSISKNTSLNIALSYLANKGTDVVNGVTKDHITNITSLGLTLQNRFSTGMIQPYIEAGLGVAYKNEKDPLSSDYGKGLQGSYGIDLIGAIGIEGYVTKHLAIKADWRYELLMHYPVIGVMYLF